MIQTWGSYTAELLNIYLCWPLTSPSRTWWWGTRPASCAPCWKSTTPWRTASSGTGMTWSTCGTTPSAQRSSTSTPATARSCWPSPPWTPPRTAKKSLRYIYVWSCVCVGGISLFFCCIWHLVAFAAGDVWDLPVWRGLHCYSSRADTVRPRWEETLTLLCCRFNQKDTLTFLRLTSFHPQIRLIWCSLC